MLLWQSYQGRKKSTKLSDWCISLSTQTEVECIFSAFQGPLNLHCIPSSPHSVLHCRYPETTLNPHSTSMGENTKFLVIGEKKFTLIPCLLEEFGSSTISHLFRKRLFLSGLIGSIDWKFSPCPAGQVDQSFPKSVNCSSNKLDSIFSLGNTTHMTCLTSLSHTLYCHVYKKTG